MISCQFGQGTFIFLIIVFEQLLCMFFCKKTNKDMMFSDLLSSYSCVTFQLIYFQGLLSLGIIIVRNK